MTPDAGGNDLRIGVLISQFTALRSEIDSRSQAQGGLVNLNITAIGALGGLGLSEHGDERLLLLIPIVSTLLGLIWLDHAANIFNIGDFIKDCLMPALASEAKIQQMPDYETFVRTYESSPQVIIRSFMLPVLLLFVIVPAISIIIAFELEEKDYVFWGLVLIDIVFIFTFLFYWWPFATGPRPKQLPVAGDS